MEVKRKYMRRDDWQRVLKKDYKYLKEIDYTAGLIHFLEIENDLTIKYPYGEKVIVKKDYKWLEVAFRNKNYFATSMFNENDELLEIYFDINKGNHFDEDDNPYFDDMFLDVVLDNSGLIYELDFDELDEALNEEIINLKEYVEAIQDKDELVNYLKENKEEVFKFFNSLYHKMHRL